MKGFQPLKEWVAYHQHRPVSVDFLIRHSRYHLFDSTASFEDSQAILMGDIHTITTDKNADMCSRLRNQTGGYILLEGISRVEHPPNPPTGMVCGAEDMDYYTRSCEAYSELKSLVLYWHCNKGFDKDLYLNIGGLFEKITSLDAKREEAFFSSIVDAVALPPGKAYLIAGCTHVKNDHLRSLLKEANVPYSAYLPDISLDSKATGEESIEALKAEFMAHLREQA
jgi:hypothetical protein